MSFRDFLGLGAFVLILKGMNALFDSDKDEDDNEEELHEEQGMDSSHISGNNDTNSSDKTCVDSSSDQTDRLEIVEEKRLSFPCKFHDGISIEQFNAIVQRVAKRIKRIKRVEIKGASISCTVDSQTGSSSWNFSVDFNDWGHITGTYWLKRENPTSSIPDHFANEISSQISQSLEINNRSLPDYSELIDKNLDLGTPYGETFFSPPSILKKIFGTEHSITIEFDNEFFKQEHLYWVISVLKDAGFKNISSVAIKDISAYSEESVYEVEEVLMDGTALYKRGDLISENTEILVRYHCKKEITIPFTKHSLKNANYVNIANALSSAGFSNVYCRQKRDLVTGWIVKGGSVDQVLVRQGSIEKPITLTSSYAFDSDLIVVYHTFKN